MFFFFIFLLQPRLVNFPRLKIVSLFIDTPSTWYKASKVFSRSDKLNQIEHLFGCWGKKQQWSKSKWKHNQLWRFPLDTFVNCELKVNGSTINGAVFLIFISTKIFLWYSILFHFCCRCLHFFFFFFHVCSWTWLRRGYIWFFVSGIYLSFIMYFFLHIY